jgi:hypothetical protein
MRVIVGAVLATLTTTCAQAQTAPQIPKDYVQMVFNVGKNFGMAEALVKSCELAVVDPKIRQNFMAHFPQNYMETFEKGFAQGWKQALVIADGIKLEATAEEKRCLLGLELYGPRGTMMENLIIPLGGNGQH